MHGHEYKHKINKLTVADDVLLVDVQLCMGYTWSGATDLCVSHHLIHS